MNENIVQLNENIVQQNVIMMTGLKTKRLH